VLEDIDSALADIYKFNNELTAFDKTLTEMDTWINGKAQVGRVSIENASTGRHRWAGVSEKMHQREGTGGQGCHRKCINGKAQAGRVIKENAKLN
jgi:hypothetical protein